MNVTKAEIKRRIKANGGLRQRRVSAEIVDEIQRCATFYNSDGDIVRLETLFWVLGFSKKDAIDAAQDLIAIAQHPTPPPVDRAAERKRKQQEDKVKTDQNALAAWNKRG